jgi:macrolide transport system ATP-binding/permease protein
MSAVSLAPAQLTIRPGERVGVVGEHRSSLLRQLSAPDLLVLDDPVDVPDRDRMVVATHDRLLLDRFATSIIEVDGARITRYRHGYAGYLAEKWSARKRWEREYLAWVTAIERGADHLWDDPVARPPDPFRFDTHNSGGLTATGLPGVGALLLEAGSRLLVDGPGRSRLLSVLAGQRRPDAGSIVRSGRIGYLPRESVVRTPDRTVLAMFARGRQGTFDQHAERLLSLGLFDEADLSTPVGTLSRDRLRRLDLARLLVSEVDVLLLDEPTLHLPPVLAEELEVALEHYAGAVVAVSSDRMFRSRWAGRTLRLTQR